jgi:hypothetical protein
LPACSRIVRLIRLNAWAAAVDLAGPQVDQLEQQRIDATGVHRLEQLLDRSGRFGTARALQPCFHRSSIGYLCLGATNVAAGARFGAASGGRTVLVGGPPGVVAWRADGSPLSVVAFTVVGGWIAAVADPARLASMVLPEPPTGP